MQFDVDIDFKTDFKPEKFLNWTRGSLVKDEKLQPHPCGYYPQTIPIDPITNLSAITYEQADELGYFKLDFLHLSVYNHFTSRKEILDLVNKEPDWSLLLLKSNVEKLFQLSRHYDLLLKIRPTSIEELADVLALIRPGKISLVNLYAAHRDEARKVLYKIDDDQYSFKRSHAISYAQVIVLQLHLIEQERL